MWQKRITGPQVTDFDSVDYFTDQFLVADPYPYLGGNRKCEFLCECARPFSMLVIADLLGVPKEDHNEVRRVLASMPGAAHGIWSVGRRTTRAGASPFVLSAANCQPAEVFGAVRCSWTSG